MVTLKQIRLIQEQLSGKYTSYPHVGLRIVDADYDDYNAKINDVLAASHMWVDGEWTADMCNGTCAIDIQRKVKDNDYAGYSGDRILVIAGESAECGEDANEIIIPDAIVIDIINL